VNFHPVRDVDPYNSGVIFQGVFVTGLGKGGEMPHYKYLIVGGGMTADAAVKSIREADSQGSIGLISEESNPPYNRPALSKGLWKGESPDRIWRGTEKHDATLHLGRRARSLPCRRSYRAASETTQEARLKSRLLFLSGATQFKALCRGYLE
jgi:hypothetical protein